MLSNAIWRVFPSAVVTPGLLVGATDSRHYQGIANNIYRLILLLNKKDQL